MNLGSGQQRSNDGPQSGRNGLLGKSQHELLLTGLGRDIKSSSRFGRAKAAAAANPLAFPAAVRETT